MSIGGKVVGGGMDLPNSKHVLFMETNILKALGRSDSQTVSTLD
jgi:hypothetical protein